MKLSKIKKALRGTIVDIVTCEDGFQWIGDGGAFYLADQELDLTRNNILAIMDIEKDKRGEWIVTEIPGRQMPQLDVCPQEGCDKALHPLISVSWAEELVTIMTTNDGEAVAVKQSAIKPAESKEPMLFVLRRSVDPDTGEVKAPVVACFDDMLCNAIIAPAAPVTVAEIWEVMRKACAEGLTYCMEEGE